MPARVLLKAFAIAFLATVVACDDSTGPIAPGNESTIHVVNGTLGDVRLKIDGENKVNSLGAGQVSAGIQVPEGTRTVTLEALNGSNVVATAVAQVVASEGTYYVAATGLDAASFNASTVADTAAIPAPGMTKLRVIHLAAAAPAFDVLRKQPDFPNAVTFQSGGAFPYGGETIYVQSTAGTWDVILRGATATGPFAGGDIVRSFTLASSDVFTIAILDGPNGTIRVERLP